MRHVHIHTHAVYLIVLHLRCEEVVRLLITYREIEGYSRVVEPSHVAQLGVVAYGFGELADLIVATREIEDSQYGCCREGRVAAATAVAFVETSLELSDALSVDRW